MTASRCPWVSAANLASPCSKKSTRLPSPSDPSTRRTLRKLDSCGPHLSQRHRHSDDDEARALIARRDVTVEVWCASEITSTMSRDQAEDDRARS